MDKKASDTFAFDLENRLDDFFSDSLPTGDEPVADASPEPEADQPLKDLKSTILAIDWEITDDALEAFINQVDELSDRFTGEKIPLTLLKLLRSLGKYIRIHKSNAHPDTIKRLMAVYSALEEVVGNDALERSAQESLLREEIRQFQRLKASIMDKSGPHRTAEKATPAATSSQGAGNDAMVSAINDLRAQMEAELAAIREAIKQLRKK